MNFGGLIIGIATFLSIGVCHPIVIKCEYHFGKECWPVFLVIGIVLSVISLFINDLVWSTVVGVLAFCAFWSIVELFEQEERVRKGWFPENPNRKKKK